MNSADLLHPEMLDLRPWLLALAGLHALLLVQQWWWQRRQFQDSALRRFGPGLSLWRGLLKLALWTMAGWYLLLALAVPQGPPIKIEGKQPGADVILCVDVSSSMLAMDVQPNRLEAVKNSLTGLLDELQGDRVGIVAFAGDAVIACPLTADYDTAALFLNKLDIDSVPRDGTGLAPALQLALDGFHSDPERGRMIVLATDGEDNAGSDVLGMARRIKQEGVMLECVGIGSTQGALIPSRRDAFGRLYAKTWHGEAVRTKLDRAGLQRIAETAGGEYLDGSSARALDEAAARVRKLKQGLAAAPDRFVRDPLYQQPLLWALLLLLAESLISLRAGGWLKSWAGMWTRLGGRWRRGAAVALLCCLALPLRAGLDHGRAPYNQGNQAYRAGDYATAARDYQQSAAEDPRQPAAPYNLGNALYRQQDYQGAVDAYQNALKLAPDDEDAKHNLEMAQRKLEQQKDGKGKDKDKKNGDKKGGQDKQGQQPGQGQQSGQGQQPGGQNSPQNGSQQGNTRGQQGRPQPGPGASRLNQDQVQAMMNQLRLDQKRYAGAFSPMKHYPRKDRQAPEDPMQQMMEQMGLAPPKPTPVPDATGNDVKDW